jgi:hypothetical protein
MIIPDAAATPCRTALRIAFSGIACFVRHCLVCGDQPDRRRKNPAGT